MVSTENPYAAPNSTDVRSSDGLDEQRKWALLNVRLAMLILLVPGLYNLAHFDSSNPIFLQLDNIRPFSVLNAIGLIALITFVWTMGLRVFEWVTAILFRLFGRHSQLVEWNRVLYETSRRLPVAAVLGGFVWGAWTYAFYGLGMDFMTASIPASIMGHVIGAAVYLPLIYRWFCLEKNARVQSPTSAARCPKLPN